MHRAFRHLVVATALLTVAGGWVVNTQHQAAAPQATAADTGSDAAARLPKAAPVAAAPSPAPAPHADTPLGRVAAGIEALQAAGPNADFQSRRAALERAASAGDANAAADLGNMLLSCEHYVEFDDTAVEELMVEGIARFGRESLDLPDSVPLDAALDAAKHAFGEMRKICSGASGLALGDDERRHALDLLRRGAQAGNVDAMTNFGFHAFTDFADRRALIADPQKVRERKREARLYLERAIAAGHVDALWAAAAAYDDGMFVEKSALLAYAHFHAYRRASMANGVDARVLDADLALYGASLTPADIAAAQRRGDEIYAACCRRGGGS